MDLNTTLRNAQSADPLTRNNAEAQLNAAVVEQYGPFLMALVSELASESNPEGNRQLAGLFIKNMITAQDESILEGKMERWLSCDNNIKEEVKAGMLSVLHSPSHTISHTGAQVIAAFGAVDVQRGGWDSLLPSLFGNVSAQDSPLTAKVSSLEALGFMCEEMDPDEVGKEIVDVILNTIVYGMGSDRENEIRKAAVAAMCNSLHFTESNFEIDEERNALMQVVCEATQCEDDGVRMKAFECIATVAELYYEKLGDYMDAIFGLTSTAIKTDSDIVGQKAIEFWCTVCDTEATLVEMLAEEGSLPDGLVFLHISEQAANELVPLLLETMTKQQDDIDEDSWDVSMAAATCLGSLSKAIGDNIVDLVVPFVSGNVMSDNWRLKEASILAFGSIMEGPSEDKLTPIVASALPMLLDCLRDDSMRVRDSATYTVGRVCEHHTGAIADELIPSLFEALAGTLEDGFSQVAMQGCTAIHHLGGACMDSSEEETNVLSPYLGPLLEKLLSVTNRDDWDENNLRSTAYEAINMLVESSAEDMQETVAMLLNEALNRLEHTFVMQTDASERMGLQSKLSSMVGICVQRLSVEAIDEEIADRIMTLTMQVFTSPGAVAHEEAFMAVGHLAEKLEGHFQKYVAHFMPALMTGLKSVEEYELCTCAVGVVGDLSRALLGEMKPFCDDIMRLLLLLLQSQALNRVVKPHVISVFADVSLAIESDFDRYAETVLGVLGEAGAASISSDDEEMIEYINCLRESILEAYIGIVQGQQADVKRGCAVLTPHVDKILEFVKRSAVDPHRSQAVLKNIIALIGDLGTLFGKRLAPILREPFVAQLLQQASEYEEMSTIVDWTKQIIMKLS